jgi:hypothetical protein
MMRTKYTGLIFTACAAVAWAGAAQAVNSALTYPGDTVQYMGDAVTGEYGIFEAWTNQPAGTGVINSFLRVQINPASGDPGIEQGYNSDYRDVQFDEKTDPNFTRSIQLSAIPVVDIGGVSYREFLLDVNEPSAGSKSTITLDEVRLYVSGDSMLHGYDTVAQTLGGLAPVWDMDLFAPPDSNVLLDYNLFGGGSGVFDMRMLIPTEVFGADETQYVYLYNLFGSANHPTDVAEAGFEEWAVRDASGDGGGPPGQVPEPGILALFGIGLAGMGAHRRRRRT